MNAESWGRDDWRAMLRALPGVDGSRKLRLWCVAWARSVLAVAGNHAPFLDVPGWFTGEEIAGYSREVDAAELYGDGLLDRRQLQAARNPRTGGPFNLFHLPSGLTRLTASEVESVLADFILEYRVPHAPELAALLREIFGNPFRPVAFDPAWRTSTAVALARQVYESREFGAMPILADALQDAGCDNEDILDHCRGPGPHCRGCWVVDLVLGKE
jgi:hypothetical protein